MVIGHRDTLKASQWLMGRRVNERQLEVGHINDRAYISVRSTLSGVTVTVTQKHEY